MRERTLVTQRSYFGLPALAFRTGSARVLARIVGLPPERARVSARSLCQDFAMDTVQGASLLRGLVADGLLEAEAGSRQDYRLTQRFVEFATARLVEPLPRERAKELLASACQLAAQVNEEWTRNPLEIEALAAFGGYMSRDALLADLRLGIVVWTRAASRRARWRHVASNAEGAREIRHAFRDLSPYLRIVLANERRLIPRPFAVVFGER